METVIWDATEGILDELVVNRYLIALRQSCPSSANDRKWAANGGSNLPKTGFSAYVDCFLSSLAERANLS